MDHDRLQRFIERPEESPVAQRTAGKRTAHSAQHTAGTVRGCAQCAVCCEPREAARRQLLALAEAYQELGSSPDEALALALRQMEATTRPPAPETNFPTFRAAAARARRLGRRFGALLPALLVLGVLLGVITNTLAGRALETQLALVRSEGAPLSLREVAPPPVPDNENAALVYRQAFERLPRLERSGAAGKARQMSQRDEKKLRDFLADENTLLGFLPDDRKRHEKVLLEAVRQALAGTDAALALARRAAAMPRCRFAVDWEAGFGALLPHLPQLRSIAQLLGAHAIVTARDGNSELALADLHALVGMSRHIGGEPILLGQLIEYACLRIATSSLRRVMERVPLDETASRQLAAELASVDPYSTFERSLEAERCLGLWGFDFVREHPTKGMLLLGEEGAPLLLTAAVPRPLGNPLLKMDETLYLRYMRREVALARERKRLQPSDWQEAALPYPWYATLTRLILPAVAVVSRRRDEMLARMAVAQGALALHVHHLQTGRYPSSLSETRRVTGLLIPADPFSGQDLRYLPEGEGFLLYSLGVNGRDDGGQNVHVVHHGRPVRSPKEVKDDIVWRVDT